MKGVRKVPNKGFAFSIKWNAFRVSSDEPRGPAARVAPPSCLASSSAPRCPLLVLFKNEYNVYASCNHASKKVCCGFAVRPQSSKLPATSQWPPQSALNAAAAAVTPVTAAKKSLKSTRPNDRRPTAATLLPLALLLLKLCTKNALLQ